MNKRLLTMVIAITVIGITLMSLGIQYVENQKSIESAQKILDKEDTKAASEAKEKGEIFYTTSDEYYNSVDKLKDNFNKKTIIHGIIIGFIILSEIGLLIVMPSEKKHKA